MKKRKKKIIRRIMGGAGLLLLLVLLLLYADGTFEKERVKEIQTTAENTHTVMAEDSEKLQNAGEMQNTEKLSNTKEPQNQTISGNIKEPQDTQPQKTPEELLEERVEEKLSSMTMEEKAAQLFIITPEALTGVGSVTQAGNATREALNQYPVGGLIYFNSNIVSEEQVTEMIARQQEYAMERIGLMLFTSIDEEGGKVTRLASAGLDVPRYSNISSIGAGGDPAKAYELGDGIGEYLSRMGFNLDFAPVADVLTNPDNTVVRDRSYGADPQLVTDMVKNQLAGLQAHQVYGCPKHFPGHGATLGDTHNGYAYTNKTWEELKQAELVPFQKCIESGVQFLMVGHISLPNVTGDDVPASLSKKIITECLKEELGFEGIVLTDAFNMKAVTNQYSSDQAAVKAVLAGVDMLLMPKDFKSAYQGVLDAVQNGTITEERLNESVRKILKVKLNV